MGTRAVLVLAGALALGCYSGGTAPAPSDGGSSEDAGCQRGTLPTCPAAPPSYQTTVQPLLNKYCAICHYPNTTIAKDDLSTYANVFADRGSCLDQTYSCAMPPATSIQMAPDERQTVLEWFVCGAPDN
jgi:hypothetical protein